MGMQIYLVTMVIMVVLANLSKAVTLDHHLNRRSISQDDIDESSPMKTVFREQLRRELAELEMAEKEIVNKLRDLTEQKDLIMEKKRGHTQCFLNLVSCYRRRR